MMGRGWSNLYGRDGETSVGCISFFARRVFTKIIKSSENKVK